MTDEEIETKVKEQEREFALTAAVRAIQTLNEVREEYRYTPETIQNISLVADMDGLREPYEFSRTLKIKRDKIEEFLKPYEEALSSESREIVEKTFFATTAKKGKFQSAANVEYIVRAKDDGNTVGVLVDPFKNEFEEEDEVLFPPFTRFKVEKIERETAASWFDEADIALISNIFNSYKLENAADVMEIKESLEEFLAIRENGVLEASLADIAKIERLIDKVAKSKNNVEGLVKIFLNEV